MWTIETAQKPEPGKNQDRIVSVAIAGGGHLVGVFDGHGRSADAAEMCTHMFPTLLRDTEEASSEQSLRLAFEQVAAKTRALQGGSTATVALLWETGLVVAAILGDSPILARIAPDDVLVGPTHNVGTNEVERKAAIARGGRYDALFGKIIVRGTGVGYEVSRSFEPEVFRPVISTAPDIRQARIIPGGWIAVMSDGIVDTTFDTYAANEAVFIELVDSGRTTADIVEYFQPKKRDDASLILCRYSRGGELVVGDKGPRTTSDMAALEFA